MQYFGNWIRMATWCQWSTLPKFVWNKIFLCMSETYSSEDCNSVVKVFPGSVRYLHDGVRRCMPLFQMTPTFDECIESLKNFRFLRNIEFPGIINLDTINFAELERFEFLAILTFQNLDLPIAGRHSIAGLRNLKKLSIIDSHVSIELLASLSYLQDIREIRLKNVKWNASGDNVFSLLPRNLDGIEIEGCWGLHDGNLLPLQTFSLKTLKIDLPASEKVAMHQLNRVPGRISLTVLEAQNLNEYEFLKRNDRIKALTFTGRNKSPFWNYLTEIKPQSLSIMNLVSISSVQLEALTSLTKLSLNLEKFDSSILKSLERLGDVHLRSLELRLPKIDKFFKLQCGFLQELSLEANRFSGEALCHVGLLQNMTKLQIVNCRKIKREHIDYLSALHFLKELRLVRCELYPEARERVRELSAAVEMVDIFE